MRQPWVTVTVKMYEDCVRRLLICLMLLTVPLRLYLAIAILSGNGNWKTVPENVPRRLYLARAILTTPIDHSSHNNSLLGAPCKGAFHSKKE